MTSTDDIDMKAAFLNRRFDLLEQALAEHDGPLAVEIIDAIAARCPAEGERLLEALVMAGFARAVNEGRWDEFRQLLGI